MAVNPEITRRPWSAAAAAAVLSLVLVVAFLFRATYYRDNYGHPDEKITIEVVRAMRQSGSWDTNWAHADLPPEWKVNQFNFSSYLYAARLFDCAVRQVPGLKTWSAAAGGYGAIRFLSALLATIAVWQTWRIGRRLGGEMAGGVAAALAAVVPLLVQDAHYARPEAWVTVLTLLAIESSLAANASGRRGFAVAVVVGLLVACKVSFLLLAWLPLFAWGAAPSMSRRRLATAGVGTAAGIAVGFALGAPFAVLHPQAFWQGVHQLLAQYSGSQPPYSNPAGGPVAGMLAAFFGATLGWPLIVVALGGAGWLAWNRRGREIAVVAGPTVVFAGFFATRSVFFERNLSHVVPLVCVLAGVGVAALASRLARARPVLTGGMALIVTGVVAVTPAEITVRLLRVGFPAQSRFEVEAIRAGLRATHPGAAWAQVAPLDDRPLAVIAQHFAQGGAPLLLEVSDTGDAWSTVFGPHLQQRFETDKIGELPGRFSDLPFSTLTVYLSPNRTYYLVRGARPGH